MLNAEAGPKKNFGKRRTNSMPDLNRDLEEDDRRVHTDPLDPDERKKYENMNFDPKSLKGNLELRKGNKAYEKKLHEGNDDRKKKNNRMRGRKDKYYE
jgi:hypothetical protein